MPLSWSSPPAVVAAIGAAAVLYAIGAKKIAGRHAAQSLIGARRRAAFAVGLTIILATLASSYDALADQSFAAHMSQHLLLVLAAAPLLAVSRVPIVLLAAFGQPLRRAFATLWARSGAESVVRRLSHPAAAWVTFTGVFLFWHLPAAFRWAQAHEAAHMLEHLSLLSSAWLFWSVALTPTRHRLSRAGAAFSVVTACTVLDLPSVVMIFAPRALYTSSGVQVLGWQLSALQDQQLAGLLMWVPGSLVFFSLTTWLFAQWMSGRDSRESNAHRASRTGSVTS
jgi:putative membrane protein